MDAYLVMGSQDKTAKLWEMETGEFRNSLATHQEGIARVIEQTLKI